jgi:hypothetical protein
MHLIKKPETTGVAPAKWTFDRKEFWLEEHGVIMEKPTFPLPPGVLMPSIKGCTKKIMRFFL